MNRHRVYMSFGTHVGCAAAGGGKVARSATVAAILASTRPAPVPGEFMIDWS